MTNSTSTTLTQQTFRNERDSMNNLPVAIDKYGGVQTKRSGTNFFSCLLFSMPNEIILAFAYLKKEADYTIKDLNVMDAKMRVTVLNPLIGYNNRAKVAKVNNSLPQTAIKLGLLSSEEFDQWVKPENILGSNL